MPLYDLYCGVCDNTYEDLCKFDEESFCPACNNPTIKCLSLPTSEVSVKYREMYQQMQSMRNKITGKTPWRKYSESQTRTG